MKNLVRMLGVSAALVSGSAIAADLAVDRVASVPLMTWTGAYAGIGVGYHAGSVTQSGCVGLCAVNPKLEGVYASIQGGYDYQLPNNIVLGVMAVIPVTPLSATYTLAPGVVFKLREEFAFMVAGRVGYAMGDFLPYVFGGYGFAAAKVTSNASPIPVVKNNHNGFTLGAGAEYRLTSNISVDLKYIYNSQAKKQYNFGGGFEQYGEYGSTVQVSLNYRFGGSASSIFAKY